MRKDNFTLRTGSEVLQVLLDGTGKRATGVLYVDEQGQEFEQPADHVILCAYGLHNTRLLLLSGIGQPYEPATGTGVVRSEERRVGKAYGSTCRSRWPPYNQTNRTVHLQP